MKRMSMIIGYKDLKSAETRKKLASKLLAHLNQIAESTAEAYQIDIYPVKEKLYYTTAEIAKIFEVSDRMVRKWCEQGKIHALQTPGGAWRILASQFKDLTKVQEFQKTAEQINEKFQEYPEIKEFE
ncbi:MAG: helix-turn-helix domain-containing protein [Firmicutes bacterium]|nr:helix-turn-helix domain-containing protein [Bacillota bacterium]